MKNSRNISSLSGSNLLGQVRTISEAYKIVEQNTGENFNLFRILGMETAEVKTHSKFLAELLDPKGSHAQGWKFLALFINYLNSLKVESEDSDSSLLEARIELSAESSTIEIEKYIGKKTHDEGGRIDICITDNHQNFICIENKIYAGEQDKQMLRYDNFAKQYKSKHLFFLTLWGSESQSGGEDGKVYAISYKKHIIEWLEICKKEAVDLPILRETIGQYVNLIKKLTHQTTNKKMETKIHRLILQNYKESSIIASNFIKAQIILFDEIFNKVKSGIADFIEQDNWTLDKNEGVKSEKSSGGIYFKPNFYQGGVWKMGISGFNPLIGDQYFLKRLFIGVWGLGGKENYKREYLAANNGDKNGGWWNDYTFVSDYEGMESSLGNQDLLEHLSYSKDNIDGFVDHIVDDFKKYFKKHKEGFERMIHDIQK